MTVRYELRGHVAVLTLNRPAARNAIDGGTAAAIEHAVDELEADDRVRAAVLTAVHSGEPPVFCAGADLKAIKAGQAAELQTERGGFAGFVYRDRAKPVIAAIDGLASSGGCEIALACDIVVASRRSSFGLAEVRWNLVPGAGGLFRLPTAVGRGVALDMILSGDAIDADRAHQLGLVSRLVDDGKALDAALELAERIAANGPMAVRLCRQVASTSTGDEIEGRRQTAAALAEVLRSQDLAEGLAAFTARRTPSWTGN